MSSPLTYVSAADHCDPYELTVCPDTGIVFCQEWVDYEHETYMRELDERELEYEEEDARIAARTRAIGEDIAAIFAARA